MPHNRRNTRLPHDHYLGSRTYFVTICCDHHKPYLRSPRLAASVLQLLQKTAANHSFLLHAYCAMPDHLHLLAQGTAPRANLLEFIWQFKQQTAFAFRKSTGNRLWEKSYHDYVLRPSDSIERIASYIWWNPVRKQICASPQDFPFYRFIDHRLDEQLRSGFNLDCTLENRGTSLKAGHSKFLPYCSV